jgi:hypothetical protein
MGTVERASRACERVTIASTITTRRMRRSVLSRVLQHGAEIGLALRSNRPLEPAKARGAGERFEFMIPLFFGEDKPGLGIASLCRFVTDVKRDRRPRVTGRRSGSKRVIDQGLHQPAPAMGGARRNMLNQPIAVTALDPAGARIRAAKEYRGQFEPSRPMSPAISSIAARADAPVPLAGMAHSAAAGIPSASAIQNCETCHQDCVCASAMRRTNARHSASGPFSAMSNQPRGRWPRCAAKIVQAIKSAFSGSARRIRGTHGGAPPILLTRSSARRGIRPRSSI